MPRLADIFEVVQSPIAVLDRGYRFAAVNPNFCQVTGAAANNILGHSIFEAFPETDEVQRPFAAAYERAFAGEKAVLDRIYYAIVTGDGPSRQTEERWWTVRLSPLRSAAGTIDHIVLAVDDRTAEVKAEQLSLTVDQELQHRMNNLLSLISVVAKRTFDTLPGTSEQLETFDGRLQAISLTNRMLTGNHWEGLSLNGLVEKHLEAYRHTRSDAISITGPDVQLHATAAQAMSMALHELATNAAKHGGLNAPRGKLAVEWSRNGAAGLNFEWREENLQDIEPPSHSGFGTILLDQLLPAQLGATAKRSFKDNQHVYSLTIEGSEIPVLEPARQDA